MSKTAVEEVDEVTWGLKLLFWVIDQIWTLAKVQSIHLVLHSTSKLKVIYLVYTSDLIQSQVPYSYQCRTCSLIQVLWLVSNPYKGGLTKKNHFLLGINNGRLTQINSQVKLISNINITSFIKIIPLPLSSIPYNAEWWHLGKMPKLRREHRGWEINLCIVQKRIILSGELPMLVCNLGTWALVLYIILHVFLFLVCKKKILEVL